MKELIALDIKKGLTATELAKKYNVRVDYIHNVCSRNHFKLARSDKVNNPKFTTFQILKELYNNESMTKIARQFNVTRTRVYQIYKNARDAELPGLPIRGKECEIL